MIASFVFAFSVYAVNGYAAHANASEHGESAAAEPQPHEDERKDDEQVERDGRRVRGRQRVPLPTPREDLDCGHVREVRDRAVRVPALDGRLAAAVRLDALAHLSVRVLRAARLEVTALRHVPVRRLTVEDPARPDDAREPDVDDAARRLEVEPDPEPEQEDGCRSQHPRRPDGRERGPLRRPNPTQRPRASRYASTG